MKLEKDCPKIPWELIDPPTPRDALPKEAVLSPEAVVALNIESLNHYGIAKGETREQLVAKLYERGAEIAAGDFTMVKRMLAAQLTLLERMANYLMTRAYQLRDYPERHDRLMRMAMRAQSQFVRTLEALRKLSKSEPTKAKSEGVKPEKDEPIRSEPRPMGVEQSPSDCCSPAP